MEMIEELKVFKSLKSVHTVIDVGARISDNSGISCDITDYLKLKPKAEYHLFEPNKKFFQELKEAVGNKKNVIFNNFGLGDEEKEEKYNEPIQGFVDGEAPNNGNGDPLPIKTLDWYIKEHNITQIDFLKIDTEGYDLKVLKGAEEALKITRYVQFETWDNFIEFWYLLGEKFWMRDIGLRNVLCKRIHGGN